MEPFTHFVAGALIYIYLGTSGIAVAEVPPL
jgi:hypothetical protein